MEELFLVIENEISGVRSCNVSYYDGHHLPMYPMLLHNVIRFYDVKKQYMHHQYRSLESSVRRIVRARSRVSTWRRLPTYAAVPRAHPCIALALTNGIVDADRDEREHANEVLRD